MKPIIIYCDYIDDEVVIEFETLNYNGNEIVTGKKCSGQFSYHPDCKPEDCSLTEH